MSVKIRLKKFGAKKRPYYRVVIVDARDPRDGATIEEIGTYHPVEAEGKQLSIDEGKARAWLDKGAVPSDTVRKLLNSLKIHVK
ncbi:MAG: 30S ribosomal protein S16 [Spirochaetales bacterium]|nr:30S ribosomal protein S16 [Spirochaetales bacterium]